ncbi:MAG: hypothetical protein J0L64_23570 [Acidobacteria bacterium]|nr:hypothetical protein [Acidobacteriota bacterium]
MTRAEFLQWNVLASICDDYEEYELVTEELNSNYSHIGLHVEPAEVIQILRNLVEQGYAAAFWLGNTTKRIEGVPSEAESEECYFIATKAGIRAQADVDLPPRFAI